MSRTVAGIYKEYQIMPNLQEHQLRVAAVASVIADGLQETPDKEKLITACLLHDMGNIVVANLEHFPQFNEPEGLAYWQNAKDNFIKKYGTDDHRATVLILKEIGLSETMVALAGGNTHEATCTHRDGDNMYAKILFYADARVSPAGVLPYEQRQKESRDRRRNKDGALSDEEYAVFLGCGKDIETQIFANSNIKPEDITDESIVPIMATLRDFVIK